MPGSSLISQSLRALTEAFYKMRKLPFNEINLISEEEIDEFIRELKAVL